MHCRILAILCLGLCQIMVGQLGVGTESPDPSSQLDIVSHDSGILIPRIALTGENDDTSIKNGNVTSLLVYNTANASDLKPGFCYWDGTKWQQMPNGDTVNELASQIHSLKAILDRIDALGSGPPDQNKKESDIRMKEEFKPSTYGLNKLMEVQVSDFKWKGTQRYDNGFLAQQLHQVYPQAVWAGSEELYENGLPKKPWVVDYGRITPMLVQAIQDQQAIIKEMRSEISELKKARQE